MGSGWVNLLLEHLLSSKKVFAIDLCRHRSARTLYRIQFCLSIPRFRRLWRITNLPLYKGFARYLPSFPPFALFPLVVS
jgi:hypothetical protein